MEASSAAELDGLVARRCAGEPLEQVLGWAELLGVRVPVSPASFVPDGAASRCCVRHWR
ncbi:MAG: hypothetical protein U0S36_12175 [Candidatus Nanopelagicales bacterium]